jgi:hypothetical protein
LGEKEEQNTMKRGGEIAVFLRLLHSPEATQKTPSGLELSLRQTMANQFKHPLKKSS